MRAVPLSNGSRSQYTFTVALALLVAIAAAQIIGAFILYLGRSRERERIAPPVNFRALAPAIPAPALPLTSPIASTNNAPRTTVRRVARPTSTAEALINQAKDLRIRGDTTNAIAKLQEAISLDSQSAEALAELAMTYESMQLFDRSNETWRRLQSLGSAAGPLYELADLKLRVGVPVGGTPGLSASSPLEAGAAPNDGHGIPDGSTFGISQVTQTLGNDPQAETKLVLRVGVKVRPNTPIDHTKVKIQVFFYDVVDNDQVVLTDADVNYEWITPGHNWADTDTEVLDVTYLRPKKNEPAPGTPLVNAPESIPDSVEKAKRANGKKSGSPTTGAEMLPTNESRKYLGYIVRVYYQDQLQAVRAEPTRLLNLFPPPFTAPSQ